MSTFIKAIHTKQCLGSIFIESGSGQKSGSRYRKPLNPDSDLSCSLKLSGINIKLFYNYKIFPLYFKNYFVLI